MHAPHHPSNPPAPSSYPGVASHPPFEQSQGHARIYPLPPHPPSAGAPPTMADPYTPLRNVVVSPSKAKRSGHGPVISLVLFFLFWMVAAGLFLMLYMDRYLF